MRIAFLGRKSDFSLLLREIKDLSLEQKKLVGDFANKVRKDISDILDSKKKEFEGNDDNEWIDVTAPGKKNELGTLHIVSQTQREIEEIFSTCGFEIADGPEIEDEWHNFDALNMPKDHPARDMQDTFWIKQEVENEDGGDKKRLVARTHTSNTQVRYMKEHTPPFRIIVPGRTFRYESTDANHEHTFSQFEALVVGDDINIANFKDVAAKFFSLFFGKEITIRLRPSYFPFTEPSFEFDISCTVCGGEGCSSCKHSGWLEIGGCGMVNQRVFESAGYERGKYQGFAWGFGIDRLAMMKYKINDIRLLARGDLRFIQQF
jgi:phenylalanyl-tRNA synthetase alpha chain